MEALRSTLENLAKMYFSPSSLHGLNNAPIQENKRENINTLHCIEEELWFVHDATIFGSAKDGMVLTTDSIYWRERLGRPHKLEYRELIESTANTQLQAGTIHVLSQERAIKIKDVFYDFIAHMRLELVKEFRVYENYYQDALDGFEHSLIELTRNKDFLQIIELLSRYEGLFLKEEDKSTKVYKLAFQAYLIEKRFAQAAEQLEVLKQRDLHFYRKSAHLLEGAIKEDEQAKIKDGIIKLIQQYNFEEAKKHMASLPNPTLKKELKELLGISTKQMHKEIRNAARNKDYGYFKSFPNIWDRKDEYGMSALEYFALAGDARGMLMILEAEEPLFMHYNIFGHHFIDLVGLACDLEFGGKAANVLDILKKVKSKVDLKAVDDRIQFLKTGQEGHFFSYFLPDDLLQGMSREDRRQIQYKRLRQLNKKLMSLDYFNDKAKEIEIQENNSVHKIIKKIFGNELEEIEGYPEKDEFETSKAYLERTLTFKKQYLDRADFINEYKRQNQKMVNKLTLLLKDNYNCFQSSLSALRALQTDDGMVDLYNLYFPLQKPSVTIGSYDADDQAFFMIVDGGIKKMYMPADIAQAFKMSFSELDFICKRMVKDGQVIGAYIFEFEGQSFQIIQ